VLTTFLCVLDACSALMGLCLTAVITYPGATMLQAAGMKRLIDTIRCQLNDHHSEFEKYYVKRNAGMHHPGTSFAVIDDEPVFLRSSSLEPYSSWKLTLCVCGCSPFAGRVCVFESVVVDQETGALCLQPRGPGLRSDRPGQDKQARLDQWRLGVASSGRHR
jgi:hypothetical protein